MVYGLCLEKMNPSRIFNLFCLYGNVVRVKFLKTKEGCAMVQGRDSIVAQLITNITSQCGVSINVVKIQIRLTLSTKLSN